MFEITRVVILSLALYAVQAAEFTVESLQKEIGVIAADLAGIKTDDDAKTFLRQHMNPTLVEKPEKNGTMERISHAMATNTDPGSKLLKALNQIDFSTAVIDHEKKSITFPSDIVPDGKMPFLFKEGHWYIEK